MTKTFTPCIPNTRATNRAQRRMILKEFHYNQAHLLEVEMSFYNELFSPSEKSYNEIYIDHLNTWQEAVFFLKKQKRLKYTDVNSHLFELFFKPIEFMGK